MSFDKPTGLQTTPLQTVNVETPQWGSAPVAPAQAGIVHEQSPAPRRRALPFTSVAFVTAVTLLITEVVAINLATSGSPDAAVVIAHVLNGLTAIPFVLGIVGVVRGPHPGWAIAAMIVSVIANPFLLRTILTFFGGL